MINNDEVIIKKAQTVIHRISDFYSGDVQFQSRLGHRISWFSSVLTQIDVEIAHQN